MNAPPHDELRARLRRVLAHIDAHLDGDLRVEALARVAHWSPYHFHRQFAALVGESVGAYVQRRRLRRAAHQLAFRPAVTVLDVALANGYEGPEAFARAFKRCVGQTPTEFRRGPRWEAWRAAFDRDLPRSITVTEEPRLADVRIVELPPRSVAVLVHRGAPHRLGESIRRFIAWRRAHGAPPSRSATFNRFYDDPATVDPAEHRVDLCAGWSGPVEPNAEGVTADTLAGGRYAVLRQVGDGDDVSATARLLYGPWLAQSGERVRDVPLLVERVRFYPEVPAHEAVTDVYLPIE